MFRRQSRLCDLFVLNRIKKAILTSYVGAGWPFDEVDVTVNTEEFYFLYSSILHVCSFVSLS